MIEVRDKKLIIDNVIFGDEDYVKDIIRKARKYDAVADFKEEGDA